MHSGSEGMFQTTEVDGIQKNNNKTITCPVKFNKFYRLVAKNFFLINTISYLYKLFGYRTLILKFHKSVVDFKIFWV